MDNVIGVFIARYNNTNNYKGDFDRCNFIVNEDYSHDTAFRSFIGIQGVDGIDIKGCRFDNDLQPASTDDIIDWGTGIDSYGAKFRVIPWGYTGNVPNKFYNLGYAVSASIKLGNKPFDVLENEFYDCFVGVRNRGAEDSNISLNEFNMGTLPENTITENIQSGICYEGAINGLECQENSFTNTAADPTTSPVTIGIFAQNTADMNKAIRKNYFDGMDFGCQAVGTNGSDGNNPNIPIRGLTFLCNTHSNIQTGGFDIDVAADPDGTGGNPTPGLVRLDQGFVDPDEGDLAAGNTFSDEATVPEPSGFRNGNSGTTINYWVTQNNPIMPSVAGNVNPFDEALLNTCPVEICYPPCAISDDEDGLLLEAHSDVKKAYRQLKQAVGSNPTTAQAKQLANYRWQLDDLGYRLVRYYLNDTLQLNQNNLFQWIDELDNVSSQLWLAKEHLAQGEAGIALSKVDGINTKYSLSTTEATDVTNFRAVIELLSNENLDSLSSTALEALVAYDSSGGQTEPLVRNILSSYGAHYPPEYVLSESQQANENSDNRLQTEVKEEQLLSVFPNPAKDRVNFRLTLEEAEETASIQIVNTQGQVVKLFTDLRNTETLAWDTKGLASGLYFYQLRTNEGIIQSGKIVLNK